MLTKTLAATAALSMLVCGGAALAAQPKSSAAQPKSSAAVAAPKQPIPYSQLDAYLKASPKARANKDWWSGSASTGSATDTSATVPMQSSPMTGATTPSGDMSAMPPATTPDTSVNPPSNSASPSMPSTPPTNAPAQPNTPDMSSPANPTQPT